MTDPHTIPPAARSWRVIVGFADPDLPNWRQVRAAQYAELTGALPMTSLAFGAAALLAAVLFATSVPRLHLLGWLAANVVLLGSAALRAPSGRAGAPDGLLRHGSRSIGLGLLWALPPAVFAIGGGTDQQLAACLLSCALMALAALTTGSVPAILLLYLAPASIGLSIMLARTGSPSLALLPPFYAALLAASGLGTARAFIARHWADQALEDKSEVVRLLLREAEDSGADWLWQVDSAKRLVSVSARFAHAAGCEPTELEGVPLLRLLSDNPGRGTGGTDGTSALRHLVQTMNGRERFSDLVFEITIGGEVRSWSLSAAPRFDGDGAFLGYRGVGSDITEQRRSAEKIDRLARFDALTGLPNRREFMDSLRASIGRALGDRQPCALLLIDLDKFKPVNDTLGHPIGDRLLKLVAERLRGLIADDDICGRLGGDEFAILIARVTPGAIERMGGNVIAALGTPFEIDGNVIRIGASIGSGLAPRDGRSVETLVRNADLALYRAKDDGRGTLRRYDPSLLIQAERRRAMETALREAIEGGDQFRLVYQPVVSTATGVIESFEALIRWNHPTLGDVPPVDFLPVAEEARLAGRIGEWVLRTACLEAASWPDDIRLSVNLALAQLHDRQFASTVLSALSHAGLEAHRLELEVSESFFLKEDPAIVAVLDAVQSLGVRLALDDFGVGYTALDHIRYGRFSAIKIDTRFVRGAADGSRESLAIVRAGVAMADALGVATVAEGAESHADLTRMRALGLDRIQGHFAGSPMAADDARGLVTRCAIISPADARRSVA
ncbi:putative bifunctional diguanylate cyclase/phosphodiesterase [Sphingomonas montana]|uniref:putative bifunctional diguanylate cyclase/phosphodiesterase n=1 Tax=Sphingomonas montana TaxID=1843236 RepID=UPI0009F938A9|nr:EAL domain-containing protein [Sphingomonas montana]